MSTFVRMRSLFVALGVCVGIVGCSYSRGDKVPVQFGIDRGSISGYWTCAGVPGKDALRFVTDDGETWEFVCEGQSFKSMPKKIPVKRDFIEMGNAGAQPVDEMSKPVINGSIRIPSSAKSGSVRGKIVGGVTIFWTSGAVNYQNEVVEVAWPVEFRVKEP